MHVLKTHVYGPGSPAVAVHWQLQGPRTKLAHRRGILEDARGPKGPRAARVRASLNREGIYLLEHSVLWTPIPSKECDKVSPSPEGRTP